MAIIHVPPASEVRSQMKMLALWLRATAGGPESAPDDPDFDPLFHCRLRHRIACQLAGLAFVLQLHHWQIKHADDETAELLERLRLESHALAALLSAIKLDLLGRN